MLKTKLLKIFNIKYISTLLGLLCALFIWQACSTKRDRWLNRTYHGITAKYNGYFNGEELIKESWQMLDKKHIDNFAVILPVYRRGTLEDSKTIVPNADKAIKKASVVIKRHSMLIKGKEKNKYIDDSYLLIGKSHFIKRDYYASLEMFTYVVREYVKNYKKDPIFFRANTWLMRAYSELGMFSDAQMAIDRVVNEKNVPQKAKGEFLIAYTDFFLKQNNFEKAQKTAAEAVSYIRNRKMRARMMYINAQLLQKAEKYKEASAVYEALLKLNPSFEMAFNARINIARCFDVNGGDSKQVRLTLAKMIKEEKHRDFLDQIYFTLGELDQKEDKIDKAIDNYNLSIRTSTVNTNQKGLSHLAIAEIYFEEAEYKLSAAQYDSAVTFIAKEYPDYKQIENKRNSLAELVKHYNTIAYNDSILRMSILSDDQLNKVIDEIIAREKEEMRKQAEKAAAAAAMAQANPGSSFMPPGGAGFDQPAGGAIWYFYNPSAMSFGFTEFRKIFGERKLEDNWRRSKKQLTLQFDDSDDDDDDVIKDDEPKEVMSPEDSLKIVRQQYKDRLPLSEEAKEASLDSIVEAYYDLGLVYKEKLKDLKKSADTYEELLRKYPDNKYRITALYQLFRLYLAMQKQNEADKYKNIILTKYPDSEYAKLIANPDFFAELAKSKKESDDFYTETFRMYKAGMYANVIERCRTAMVRFAESEMLPKFAYLKALALGKQRDVEAFRTALIDVVRSFPGDTVRVQAKELLDVLNRAQGIVEVDSTQKAPEEKPQIFTYNADTTHYFAIWLKDKKLNTNNLKIAISDFNNKLYSLAKLQVGTNFVDPANQVIMIREFSNLNKAAEYLNTLGADTDVTDLLDFNKMELLLISAKNFNKLMKEKNIQEYFDYYKKVYQ